MSSETVCTLEPGKDSFTLLDLLRKAAAYKGLKYQEGGTEAHSEPFATYTLDDKLLAHLEKYGIKRENRPDKIFTLVDENLQEKVPGWSPSNIWNFKLVDEKDPHNRQFDLKIILSVGFGLEIKERGFKLWPQARGTFISACDHLPNFRMFKTLVESGRDLPSVAKEIAQSEGHIVVTWTDLGLGGIRRIGDLFDEFACGNGARRELALRGGVFQPAPQPRHQQPGEEQFIAEPAQPEVFRAWRAQLREYVRSLASM